MEQAQYVFDRPLLDRGFNSVVQAMARRFMPQGFDVSSDAPDTLEALRKHYKKTGRILVWNGASDRTIFGDPEVNFAFRAWHDYTHLKISAPFDRPGETAVALVQTADMYQRMGYCNNSRRYARIIDAEIVGQLRHQETFGEFPEDQLGFVQAYLKNATRSLITSW